MSHLLLARHGQSVSNAVRRFQGSQDVPLSELGMSQAKALGAALSHRRVAAVYASPLERARRTAEIAAAQVGLSVTCHDDLRELSLGEWEGCTVDQIQSLPGDPYAQWRRDPLACAPPGGEPLTLVQHRVVAALAEICARHPNGAEVLVVGHGGTISAYLAHFLGLPLSAIWRLSVANCSISEVAPPRVISVNSTVHLMGLATGSAVAPTA